MSASYPYNPIEVTAAASNIIIGDNPVFGKTDFLAFYPQFTNKIPDVVLNSFIAMASASINQQRWFDQWSFAMSLFIAHFATLYLQSLGSSNTPASQVIAAGQSRGLISSKSVGDVSVSYDHSSMSDLDGWAAWKLTSFGQQLATLGRIIGKGCIYVQ